MNDIMNSRRFKINAMKMCRVEQANAEEFYEVILFGLSYERPYLVLDLNSIMICMVFACV